MSLEDLEQAGLLLPREEWGKHELTTTAKKPILLILGAVALLAVGWIYWGDGRFLTWIGAGLFLIVLFGFILLSIQAINRQCEEP
ncbi:hypothetical protein MYX75_06640 [Acidobacteria bacterium AH-259-A15]|nr:hypothetical protein [Acidobacteria bacterium AH-259-A15]